MTEPDIEGLEAVVDALKGLSTPERAKLVCQAAEAIDDDSFRELEHEIDTAYNYPSMAGMTRPEANRAHDRVKALKGFRKELAEAGE